MDNVSDIDPTMEQAMAAMDAADAAEASASPPAPPKDSATPPARAGQETEGQVQPPKTEKPADAPATAETVKPAEQKTEPKPGDKSVEEAKTPFAKNQQRLQGGWKALNEEKTAFQKERDTVKAEREELTRKQKAFEQQQQAATRPKHTPEQIEAHAATVEREAEALEAAGKYDEADKRRFKAEEFRQWAKELRANPPPPVQTDKEVEAQFAKDQKEWWGKAAIDFPNVAKADTAEAKALKALIEANPQTFGKYPDAMYWGARLVSAETAAAGVAADKKELGELRAKVKDLNEQLAIPGDGAAGGPGGEPSFEQKSEEAQEAELRAMAAQQPQ